MSAFRRPRARNNNFHSVDEQEEYHDVHKVHNRGGNISLWIIRLLCVTASIMCIGIIKQTGTLAIKGTEEIKLLKQEIRELKTAATDNKESFKQEIRELKTATTDIKESFKQEIREMKIATRDTKESFKQEIREMKTAARDTKESFKQEIRESKKVLKVENQEGKLSVVMKKQQEAERVKQPVSSEASMEIPAFHIDPSNDSICHLKKAKVEEYCTNDNNAKLLRRQNLKEQLEHELHSNLATGMNEIATNDAENCKTLWFSGLHESCPCKVDGLGYKGMYGAALNSAIINAGNVLQPVILLATHGLPDENNPAKTSKFGKWAETKGAWTINVPKVSFQDYVDQYMKKKGKSRSDFLQGVFLRLDLPKIIKEHSLMDLPNICKNHVLFTDVDVLFANKLTHKDIDILRAPLIKGSSSSVNNTAITPSIMYGRQFFMDKKKPINTGVMMLDVNRFEQLGADMIEHAKVTMLDGHPQDIINHYFNLNKAMEKERTLLPIHYNWKHFWKLEPSSFEDVKILHLNDHKPGNGLETIAQCNIDEIKKHDKAYKFMIDMGICFDKGRTAKWALDAIEALSPSFEEIC